MKKRKRTAQEVKEWYQLTGALTYCNKDDANLIVKKPRSEGWTVNWANSKAYLLQAGILAIVIAIIQLF